MASNNSGGHDHRIQGITRIGLPLLSVLPVRCVSLKGLQEFVLVTYFGCVLAVEGGT
jgi:hypothetical protein